MDRPATMTDQQLVDRIRRLETLATIFYFAVLGSVILAAVRGTWQFLIPAVLFDLWRSTALRLAFIDLTEALDRGRQERWTAPPVVGGPRVMGRRVHGRAIR